MFSMKKLLNIIVREGKQFISNKPLMLIIFGGSLFFPVIIGLVYINAKPAKLPITILDYDNTQLSQNIAEAFDDNQFLKVYRITADQQQAVRDFQKVKVEAVVTIPESFEADVQMKHHPEIQLDLNSSNILTSNYINTGVNKTLAIINAGIQAATLQKGGMPESSAMQQFESFRVNYNRFYNRETNYLKFLWPGVVGTVLQQIFLMAIALMFAYEFEKNTFPDLLTRTHSASFMIFAKSLPYFVLMMIIWMAILVFLFPVFKVEIVGSVWGIGVFSALFLLSILALGVMVSVFTRTMIMATDVLMIIATPSFIVSGFTWPVSAMPSYMQFLANLIPITPFLEGYRKMLLMGNSLADLMPEIRSLTIMTLVFGVIGWLSLKIRIKQYLKKRVVQQ